MANKTPEEIKLLIGIILQYHNVDVWECSDISEAVEEVLNKEAYDYLKVLLRQLNKIK